jgi:phenylalanyl-tRNA synthetase alpha chain
MTLEQDILGQIAGAVDEAALEAIRVATLGKKGSISEQMKSLGAMSPDERKTAGAALNVLKRSPRGNPCCRKRSSSSASHRKKST